ncbi:DUF6153 family protein [Streptomyces sp. B1866]|uniref:DUF6153 family protein n=1 Tax=Streptomyces sp. B1866 TaxID=3075431 RepID=UPI00288D9ACE|nr:DUF6153 family protein [Streptomyces sp. B1866]MDT3397597.1 DUF6153 family protein [Streptomyces sp. B1866]
MKQPPPSTRRARRAWAALALLVLAGVLGMHGLAPAGMSPAGGHSAHAAVGHPAAAAPMAHHAAPDASGAHDRRLLADPADDGTAAHHADGTCAAGGVSGAYHPPALAPGLAGPAPAAAGARQAATGRHADGRAPPDLAELQLLRI